MKCSVETSTGGGNAVITTADGETYVYNKKEGVQLAGSTNLSMWLHPCMGTSGWDEDDEFPFPKITDQIDLKTDRHYALQKFLSSLDRELKASTRNMAAREAEQLFNRPEIADHLRIVLLDRPLPEIADQTHGPREGPAGEILKSMIEKWRP